MSKELYKQMSRNEKMRVAAFEGCAYTLDDFRRELEIYERLHSAWGLRFVQSVLAPTSTVWFAHDDAGIVKGAVKADSFEGDISNASFVSFYWEPVRNAIMAADALSVPLRLVAASGGKLYSAKSDHGKGIEGFGDGTAVRVGTRTDKGGVDADQEALVLWIPRSHLKLVREP